MAIFCPECGSDNYSGGAVVYTCRDCGKEFDDMTPKPKKASPKSSSKK